MIGRTLAQYTILGKIGEGGMGEVWKARDTSLNREAAIKALPQIFAQDPERLTRFEREAQLLAALDHPGLATVYGLHEEGGTRFLAMELVPGKDLSHQLIGGPLPVQDALEIAVQIAAALEAAHGQNVVHRDLKPSNIMVTPEGRVKVLDFGLALSVAGNPGSSNAVLSHSPTIASPATADGVILGTAAYMSPEQARGKPVDSRSDLWAFGCVLYEMLTGHMLFAGETVSDCVARILTGEPDWNRLPPDTPVPIRNLIRRCLTRDLSRRQQSAGDARVVIAEVLNGEVSGAADPDKQAVRSGPWGGTRRRVSWIVVAAVVAGFGLGGLAWNLMSGRRAPRATGPVARLSVVLPDEIIIDSGQISPDGRTLAFMARPRNPSTAEDELDGVYLRRLDSFEFQFVPGSRGAVLVGFSADGRWFVMVAPTEPSSTKYYLWKVPVDGSAPPLKLLDWNSEWTGLHWLPDGDLIVGTSRQEIIRVHPDGRPPEPAVPIRADIEVETGFSPQVGQRTRLPDGHHLLSSVEIWGEGGYSQNIVALDIRTAEMRVIIERGANPRWSDTGHLLFSRGASLLAVPFDPDRLEITGGPTAMMGDLRIRFQWQHGNFDLAGDGSLLYAPGGYRGGDRRLIWLDREFNELGPWSDKGLPLEEGPIVSPDGRRFTAVIAGDDGVYDIWMSEPDRPILQKWLEEPNRDVAEVLWSPDGSDLVYSSRTQERTGFYMQSLTKEAPPTLLFEDTSSEAAYKCDAFADGGATLLVTRSASGTPTLLTFSLEGSADRERTMETLLEGAGQAQISADGRWMVYTSDTSGRVEVYLRRWKGNGGLGPERRVSTDGGDRPLWYAPADGGPPEIWFLNSRKIYSVPVGGGEDPALPRPKQVADWKESYLSEGFYPDGRILMRMRGEGEKPAGYYNLIPGWSHNLK